MVPASPDEWVTSQICRRAGVTIAQWDSIAEAPIYQVLDSLDLVELLGSVESCFLLVLQTEHLHWDEQPSVREFADQLIGAIKNLTPRGRELL